MELLYVWIQDYKNIKQQGFNFSPKWRFHYDPVTGKLDVEDRRDKVIDNFFGEHISNVTAIVGENGSGKSNLLEFIMLKLYYSTGFWDEHFLFITSINDKLMLWKYQDLPYINKDQQIELRDFKMADKGDGLHGLRDNTEFDHIHCVYFSNSFTGTPRFQDNGSNKHFFDISSEGLYAKSEWNESIYQKKELQKQIQFIGIGGNNITGLKLPDILKIRGKYNAIFFSTHNPKLSKETLIALAGIETFFQSKSPENKLYQSLLFAAFYEACTSVIGEAIIKGMYRQIVDGLVSDYKFFGDIATIYLVNHSAIIELTDWAKVHICQFYNENDNCFDVPIDGNIEIGLFSKLIHVNYQFVQPFEFNWYYKDSTHETKLSLGEVGLLSLFSRIFSLKVDLIVHSHIFFFIDEGEIGFHPEWQRKFIKLLINNLVGRLWYRIMGRHSQIQIIFTTHSPFLLSDLPKENVIFLKKGKDGNGQVVDGLNDMKQTFGANIHTLLSDSFFMDGLMGDFAKEKIDKVIRYLNDDLKAGEVMMENEARKIINMIGEPILKRHLEQQFQNKRQKREIEELRAENTRLKANQNKP